MESKEKNICSPPSPNEGGEGGAFEAPILLSALQHYCYCPRQFALIHMEGYWRENFFTADGRCLHERVDLAGTRRGGEVRVAYAMPIASEHYGLTGRCDAVEFWKTPTPHVVPVEYKRGGPKPDSPDEVQLCAQVLCLEEMLHCSIESGALFYFEHRERLEIPITDILRSRTLGVIGEIRELLSSGALVPPSYDRRRCGACSLAEYCMPRANDAAALYMEALS